MFLIYQDRKVQFSPLAILRPYRKLWNKTILERASSNSKMERMCMSTHFFIYKIIAQEFRQRSRWSRLFGVNYIVNINMPTSTSISVIASSHIPSDVLNDITDRWQPPVEIFPASKGERRYVSPLTRPMKHGQSYIFLFINSLILITLLIKITNIQLCIICNRITMGALWILWLHMERKTLK